MGLVLSGVSSDTPPPGTKEDSPIPTRPSSVCTHTKTLLKAFRTPCEKTYGFFTGISIILVSTRAILTDLLLWSQPRIKNAGRSDAEQCHCPPFDPPDAAAERQTEDQIEGCQHGIDPDGPHLNGVDDGCRLSHFPQPDDASQGGILEGDDALGQQRRDPP